MSETLNPDYQLDSLERSNLAVVVPTDGFKVIQKIFKSVVDTFATAMLNADPADEKRVIAAHYLAKAAAQIYTMVVDRINHEVALYASAPRLSDKAVDITEGLIDLGDVAAQLPNIFGGEELNE